MSLHANLSANSVRDKMMKCWHSVKIDQSISIKQKNYILTRVAEFTLSIIRARFKEIKVVEDMNAETQPDTLTRSKLLEVDISCTI